MVVEIEIMDKKEIESFIMWYLPAIALSLYVYGSLYLSPEGISFGTQMDIGSSYLGHLICAFWLFKHAPKHQLNKWLWAVFGLGLGLFSMIFYFIYCTTNKNKQNGTS